MKKIRFTSKNSISVDKIENYDIIVLDEEFILKELNYRYHWAELFGLFISSNSYASKAEAVLKEYDVNNKCDIRVYNDSQDLVDDLFLN